jgi:hypothetical protein
LKVAGCIDGKNRQGQTDRGREEGQAAETEKEGEKEMNIKEELIDYKYSRLLAPYQYKSKVLGCTVTVPTGFIYDHESVPIIKGTSHRGGLIHDYLCRIDSKPVVTKKQAADAYLEVMALRGNPWWRRYAKYWVVRFAFGYFHKLKVNATYEEITGRKEDEKVK